MRKLQWFALLSVCGLSTLLFADQVVLNNGDRLTGTITKSDGKTLVIKTEFAGEVTIQWPAIQSLTSATPLHVATAAKTVVGPVTTTDGTLAVNTSQSGTVDVPRAQVTALRDDKEQAAYEKSLHPNLLQGWVGGANVGFALTAGNSETENLALAFTADRKTSHDEIVLYTNTIYATNNAPGAVPGVTANATQGGARYDRNLTKRLFAFGGADFQTDALQNLNLRSVLGGGLGYHLINTSRTTLDFLGGVNYTKEDYIGLDRNFAALTLGEELMHKMGASTVVMEKLYFYPGLSDSDSGEYRAAFNLGTITKISKWLGWQNAFGDIYVTNPPVGKRTNDLQLTTGINVAFTH
jgi:putative salt-induced outer membrane protein